MWASVKILKNYGEKEKYCFYLQQEKSIFVFTKRRKIDLLGLRKNSTYVFAERKIMFYIYVEKEKLILHLRRKRKFSFIFT